MKKSLSLQFMFTSLLLSFLLIAITQASNQLPRDEYISVDSCEFVNWSCCIWWVCSESLISCANPNTIAVIKWCDEKCVWIVSCEVDLQNKKIQKINEIIVKTDYLVKYLQSINTNYYNLKTYITNLDTLRNNFNAANISYATNFNTNKILKNVLVNLQKDLNQIRSNYK